MNQYDTKFRYDGPGEVNDTYLGSGHLNYLNNSRQSSFNSNKSNNTPNNNIQSALRPGIYNGSPRGSFISIPRPTIGDVHVFAKHSPYQSRKMTQHGNHSTQDQYNANDRMNRWEGYQSQTGYGMVSWDAEPIMEPKSFRGVVARFAHHTSLQGIPFILRAKKWYAKLIWTLLFLAALVVTSIQLYEVITKWSLRETTTSISLGYANLEYPSITICNINPIRNSMINETKSKKLDKLLKTLHPPEDYDQGKESIYGRRQPPALQGRKKRNVAVEEDDDIDSIVEQKREPPPGDEDKFGRGNVSSRFLYEEVFYDIMSELPMDTRRHVGHKQDTLILNCQMNGRECDDSWSQSLSREYGNCFTFNSVETIKNPVRSQKSGAQFGLNLILYIEDNEYLRGITQGSGVRVDIHPYNTLPFTTQNGLSVAPGTETFIGLKLVEISRIGSPYKYCGDGGQFKQEYGKKYTVEACTVTCLDRKFIGPNCGCYRQGYESFYGTEQIKTLKPCARKDDSCVLRWRRKINQNEVSCQCYEECRGSSYDITPSYNYWPDSSSWYNLVDMACEESNEACRYLKNKDDDKKKTLEKNFISLRIFYRDLNFESIVEQPAYADPQFVSDLGGTFGLWIGASVLSIMEILDFFFQAAIFPCKKKRRGTGLSSVNNNKV